MKFDSIETRDEVLQRGCHHFGTKPFIITPSHENFQVKRVEKVPMWVRFPKLDPKYWGLTSLSKLASLLRIPIMADKNTMQKNMVNYATVIVEMPILKKIPSYIIVDDEKGIIQQQRVDFEHKPAIYEKCKKYGHEVKNCNKKKGHLE